MSIRSRSSTGKKRPRLRVGANAVCTGGQLAGVDPFTRLVVTAIHKDGTVDVTRDDNGAAFHHVNPDALMRVE
jgi:hypothetical protein